MNTGQRLPAIVSQTDSRITHPAVCLTPTDRGFLCTAFAAGQACPVCVVACPFAQLHVIMQSTLFA